MSIFASETTSDPIPIPFDPPHTITVRALTGTEIERAQLEDMFGVKAGSARTWAARIQRLIATGDVRALESLSTPLLGYDRLALVRAGLVAWSYPKSLKAILAQDAEPASDGKPAKAAVEAYDPIADLVDEALDFFAETILRLTKPLLFVTSVDEGKREQKKAEAAVPDAAGAGADAVEVPAESVV